MLNEIENWQCCTSSDTVHHPACCINILALFNYSKNDFKLLSINVKILKKDVKAVHLLEIGCVKKLVSGSKHHNAKGHTRIRTS